MPDGNQRVVSASRQSSVNHVKAEPAERGNATRVTQNKETINGGFMDNKPRPKPDQGSSWNDENEKMTNPNRRQDEDRNVESGRSGQRASKTDEGSSESPTDRNDSEQLHSDRNRQSDSSGRIRHPEE